ncbi:Hsp33 family molecular chaperone HslO, partial [Myxococcota bacterium]|nr:Hsp33 family molecular chaperone HslO [Myxococcota bacterium]
MKDVNKIQDGLQRAILPESGLVVAWAQTTTVCDTARESHHLTPSATVALGRLMTSVALAGLLQKRDENTSIQISGNGRLGQVFADITKDGDLRGYIRNPHIGLPLDTMDGQRHSLCSAVGDGSLSVIRVRPKSAQGFVQSSTPLLDGDIDTDVEHFLLTSEQIETALSCDVVFNENGDILSAGGIIVQALPGGDLKRLKEIKKEMRAGRITEILKDSSTDIKSQILALLPDAEMDENIPSLRWYCRCSRERALEST